MKLYENPEGQHTIFFWDESNMNKNMDISQMVSIIMDLDKRVSALEGLIDYDERIARLEKTPDPPVVPDLRPPPHP